MINKTLKFPDCNCEFDILSEDPLRLTPNSFDTNIENVPLDCPRTWDLICNGDNCCTFQLESQLGRSTAKKLKPQSIEELSALLSIIRPGCLDVVVDNKTITQHYIDRKNGEEPVEYYHPALESILKETYGLIVFQEQAIRIVQDIAGFDLQQSEVIRRAIGKKKDDLMAKVRKQFVKGCKKKKVVNEKEAETIFDWIEKSSRYSFNKCVSPNTQVELEGGGPYGHYVTIEQVKIGQKIRTPEGFCRVIDKIDTGTQLLYKVTLGNGQSITCTMNHKFLCQDGGIRPLYQILKLDLELLTHLKYYLNRKIYKVKRVGEFPTIDIEVDNESHTYYANGIATSNSHAISYAMNSYLSAYCRAHFLLPQLTSYLRYSKNDLEEVEKIVNSAKMSDVTVLPPDIRHRNTHFKLIDNKIYFGLSNIKGIGLSAITKLNKVLTSLEKQKELGIIYDFGELSWLEFLLYCSPHLTSTLIKTLISTGGLDYVRLPRTQMLYEYNVFSKLSKKREISWMISEFQKIFKTETISLAHMLKLLENAKTGKGGGCASITRKKVVQDLRNSLANPPYSLLDSIEWISKEEKSLLGISLSCNETDSPQYQQFNNNCSCKEFVQKTNLSKSILMTIKLENINVIKTKRGKSPGKSMAFLTISDGSGMMDSVVVFPEQYKEFQEILVQGNIVNLVGERGKEKDTLIIKKALTT